jgi:rfaE bifunctional protein kinase chain/domain
VPGNTEAARTANASAVDDLPLGRSAVPAPGKKSRLRSLVRSWQGKRVLVLGDVVADEHVVGRPRGVAREAPVLVLQHLESALFPGGATNVAANAAALGAAVSICGVVGDDEIGRRLVARLREAGMACDGVFVDPSRPTTTKTRIWAGGAQQQVQQLLLRLDRLERNAVSAGVTERMAGYVRAALPRVDALLISDYENGVIHPALIEASLPPALARGTLVAVDSHGDLIRFRGAALFTPNQPEAEAAAGRAFASLADLEAAGRELVGRLEAQAVLITRGREGMTLIPRAGAPLHLPAVRDVAAVDPTGAGDTVAAAFTLAAAAGGTYSEAAALANLAGGIAVSRVGTATTSAADLEQAIDRLAE